MTFKLRKRHNPLPPVQFIPADKLETILHGAPDPDRRGTAPVSAGAIEARRLLAVAKQTYASNEKEKQMPDMQTALSKVINDWEKETTMNDTQTEQAPKQDKRITTGVSHATFDHVKRNPGKTKAVVVRELDEQGFKPTSTTTLLSAMIRQKKIIVDVDGKLRAASDSYTPVKYMPVKRKQKAAPALKQAKIEAVTPQGLAALYVQPTAAPAPKPTTINAQYVMETLNVKEAYELFLALSKMFA